MDLKKEFPEITQSVYDSIKRIKHYNKNDLVRHFAQETGIPIEAAKNLFGIEGEKDERQQKIK